MSDEDNPSEGESYVSDESLSDEYSDDETDGQVCFWTEKMLKSRGVEIKPTLTQNIDLSSDEKKRQYF